MDKTEVQRKSSNMEREGLSRCLAKVQKRCTVSELATDASTSVAKVLRRHFVEVCILYIICHL